MRPAFFYATGTSYLINVLETGFSVDMALRIGSGGVAPGNYSYATIDGLNGQAAVWDLTPPNDPFPALLNPDKWEAVKIPYPAVAFPMGASINYGISQTISHINRLPRGRPFALGGMSQGAAVMSGVYNELRYGSLTSRLSDFLGATVFGNPRRQQNWRGPIGGAWSGAWDVPASYSGGHGSFPASGPWARLSNCGDEWVDFVMPDDIFAATGDSDIGTHWVEGNNGFLDLGVDDILAYFANGMAQQIINAVGAAFNLAGTVNNFLDAVGKPVEIGGAGHTAYAFLPPVDVETTKTSYQLALEHLDSLADEWATAPVALASTATGWSTTLLPPTV